MVSVWRRYRPVSLLAGMAACGSSAAAQSIVDTARRLGNGSEVGHAFNAFGVLGSTPGISAARFNSEMDLRVAKLPIMHSFRGAAGSDPAEATYVELTLSHVTASDAVALAAPGETIRLKYKSWSGLAGAGPEFRIGPSTRLRALALGGYTRLTGDAVANGTIGTIIVGASRGILSDVHLESALVGSAIEVSHDHLSKYGLRFRGKARYNLLIDVSTGVSDPSLRTHGVFSVATASGELSGPLHATIIGRDLRWLGFTKATYFSGGRKAFGFDTYGELGGGLELMTPAADKRLKGIVLRGSAIVGPHVHGWTAGLGFDL